MALAAWLLVPGRGSFAGTFYFATDTAVLVSLGGVILAVAILRARCMPRWIPVVGAVASVAALMIPPASVGGHTFEAAVPRPTRERSNRISRPAHLSPRRARPARAM